MPKKIDPSRLFKDIPASTWERLSQQKTYFGHHSVGFNIVDGINDLMKEHSEIQLNIVETNDPADFNTPLFAHSRVGKNTDPQSKIDAFASLIEKGIGNNADIAFFKFCYVDIKAATDIDAVFSSYKKTMSQLKRAYPETTFVHVTVPLTRTKTSLKTLIKKMIGKKDIWEYDDNIARNGFNKLLRSEYQGKEPIFDLSRYESSFPDGTRQTFSKDGDTYYSMMPDYTNDGGHLNDLGQKMAAGELLGLLATLSASQR